MKTKKRTCVLCGTSYKYCSHCAKTEIVSTWKNLFDKETCRDLYDLLVRYKEGAVTLEDAQAEFAALDTGSIDLSNISAYLQIYLNEIIGVEEEDASSKKTSFFG